MTVTRKFLKCNRKFKIKDTLSYYSVLNINVFITDTIRTILTVNFIKCNSK